MLKVSRRDLVLSAAGAAALFGLNRHVTFIDAAQAKSDLLTKGFMTFKVGDVEVTSLFDGIWEKAHDDKFIRNATVQTKAALKAGGLADAFVPITFTALALKIKGDVILVDSGTGGQAGGPKAGLMMKHMAAAGIDAKSVKTILISHFHPDHIFGLMAKGTNAQVFPNAEIIVPSAEYKFWTDPALIPKLPAARQGLAKRIQATFPTWKNLKQAEAGKEVVPGVTMLSAHGHTPGHSVFRLSSGSQQFMIMGDTSNVPALFVRNPGWQAIFDADPKLAESNRRKLFEQAVADKAIVAGYHFGLPNAGTLAKDGSGYAFVPMKA